MLLVASIILATVKRSPYVFLDRFNPRRVEANMAELSKLMSPSVKRSGLPRITVLEFRREDGPAVLAAMQSELTTARGFSSRDESATSMNGRDVEWLFGEGALPPRNSQDIPREASMYVRGEDAQHYRDMFEKGKFVARSDSTSGSPQDFIVVLAHQESWSERAVRAACRFLHISD